MNVKMEYAIVTLLLVVVFTVVQAGADFPADPICGPASLAVVFEHLGVDYEVQNVFAITGYTPERGTTLYGLDKCARSHGLYTVALTGKVSDMMALFDGDVCAIQGGENHFRALICENAKLHAVDPVLKTILPVSDMTLHAQYPVLFISTRPIEMSAKWQPYTGTNFLQRVLMAFFAVSGLYVCCLAASAIHKRRVA